MKKVNVKGTAAILAASKKAGVSRFFFISTHSVYGKKSLVSMLLRGRPWKPVTAYGKDKLKAESLCGEYIRQKSLNITIFRPAPVISPGIKDPAALACLFMALRENGKGKIYISSYSGRRQLLHIGDAVEAILASDGRPVSIGQIYDIGSDDVPTHKEEIDALREKAGLDCEVKILSRARIRLYRCLFALAGGHLFTGEHFRSLIASRVTDCRKIKDELNWRPRKGNIDILTETILWYKKEKLKI
jgi:dTDP-glucose 4,6-dehydratase